MAVTPLSMRAYVTHKHVRDGSCGTNGSLIHGGTKLKATKSLPIGEQAFELSYSHISSTTLQ